MLRIETYDHHSYCPDLMKPGGFALDAGCRGFGLTRHLAERGSIVFAIDADQTIPDPSLDNVWFYRLGLVSDNRAYATYAMWSTGEGNHLCTEQAAPGYATTTLVPCTNLTSFMSRVGVSHFDLVKLDIEGAEYQILLNWPGPIASQISVEFHDFTGMNPCKKHEAYYIALNEKLSQWYKPLSHKKTVRNKVENYWDSLFVLKELCAA